MTRSTLHTLVILAHPGLGTAAFIYGMLSSFAAEEFVFLMHIVIAFAGCMMGCYLGLALLTLKKWQSLGLPLKGT